jgi:hypothetical protein
MKWKIGIDQLITFNGNVRSVCEGNQASVSSCFDIVGSLRLGSEQAVNRGAGAFSFAQV